MQPWFISVIKNASDWLEVPKNVPISVVREQNILEADAETQHHQ